MPTREETAYFAGMIDGEGTICCRRISNRANTPSGFKTYYTIDIAIHNSHRGVLEWLAERFCGQIYTRERRKEHHKRGYVLRFTNSQKMLEILETTVEFLIVKREQALAAIEFLRVQIESSKTRNVMYLQMAEAGEKTHGIMGGLNHRGTNAVH
jgi:hypothetical protein